MWSLTIKFDNRACLISSTSYGVIHFVHLTAVPANDPFYYFYLLSLKIKIQHKNC